jgi:hypothetical protein
VRLRAASGADVHVNGRPVEGLASLRVEDRVQAGPGTPELLAITVVEEGP